MAGRGVDGGDNRPSSSASLSGWRSTASSSRGVAHRFRNFCITNDHPEGIVYCQPNSVENSGANSNSGGGEHDSPQSSPSQVQSLSPQRPSSPSSSVISCSPTNPLSPCSSDVSETGTIVLSSSSSSSDEDYDEYNDNDNDNLKNKDYAQEDKEQENDVQGKAHEATETPANQDSMKETGNIKNEVINNENIGINVPTTPSPPGHPQDVLAAEENVVPQFIHHKKFHYKQVQAAAAATAAKTFSLVASNSAVKNARKTATVSGTVKKPVEEKLTVDNLKLSPYITREQAAKRLKILGNLEETQKEINDIAAIICTSEMYRLKLRNENRASCDREHPPLLTSHSLSPVKSRGNQVLHPVAMEQQSIQTSIAVSTGPDPMLRSNNECLGSGVADEIVYENSGASGGGEGAISKNVSGGGDDCDEDYDEFPVPERKKTGGGGYFQITSPGQTSTGDEYYEWISDADE